MSPTDYTTQIAHLRAVIRELRDLRDSQGDGADTRAHYQEKIHTQSRILIALEASVGDLTDADTAITEARLDLRDCDQAFAAEMNRWWSLVKIGGGVGALALTVTYLFDVPGWVPTVGVLALVVAVGAIVAGFRRRPGHLAAVEDADAALQARLDERAAMDKRIRSGRPAISATTPATPDPAVAAFPGTNSAA